MAHATKHTLHTLGFSWHVSASLLAVSHKRDCFPVLLAAECFCAWQIRPGWLIGVAGVRTPTSPGLWFAICSKSLNQWLSEIVGRQDGQVGQVREQSLKEIHSPWHSMIIYHHCVSLGKELFNCGLPNGRLPATKEVRNVYMDMKRDLQLNVHMSHLRQQCDLQTCQNTFHVHWSHT